MREFKRYYLETLMQLTLLAGLFRQNNIYLTPPSTTNNNSSTSLEAEFQILLERRHILTTTTTSASTEEGFLNDQRYLSSPVDQYINLKDRHFQLKERGPP
jgi:hypothetical protein